MALPRRAGSSCRPTTRPRTSRPFVAAVRAKLPASARVLIVDDSSPDGTGEIADRLAAERRGRRGPAPAAQGRPRPRLHRRLPPRPGRRRRAGRSRWTPTSPTTPPTCRGCWRRRGGADLVLGSRYVPGGGVSDWGPLRRAISRGGSAYARLVLGVDVRDLTGGFKCFRREVLEAIDLDAVQRPRLRLPGRDDLPRDPRRLRVVEVPIVFRDRRVGHLEDETARSSPRRSGGCRFCASAAGAPKRPTPSA